jgi:beta-phosphoglucomutase-like phosphatase (HAD superfamily)
VDELELVIFGCDGVLVDSEVISNSVLAQMLSEEGLATTLAQARRDYQGLLLDDVLRVAEAKLGRALPAGWLARYESSARRLFAASSRRCPALRRRWHASRRPAWRCAWPPRASSRRRGCRSS